MKKIHHKEGRERFSPLCDRPAPIGCGRAPRAPHACHPREMIRATWDAILAGLTAIKAGEPLVPLGAVRPWLDEWHSHLGVPPHPSLSLGCEDLREAPKSLLFTELAIADLVSIRAVLGVRRRQARIVADTLGACFEGLLRGGITAPIRRGMVAGTEEVACVTPAEDGCIIPPYGCVLYWLPKGSLVVVRIWDDGDERREFERVGRHTREHQADS